MRTVLGLQTACGQGRNENYMGKEGLLRAAWMPLASKVQSSACCAMRTLGLVGKKHLCTAQCPAVPSAGTLLLQGLAILLQHRDCSVAFLVVQPWGRGKHSGFSQLSHSLTKHLAPRGLHPVFVSMWLIPVALGL